MLKRWNVPDALISVESDAQLRVGHPSQRLLQFSPEDDAPAVLDKVAKALQLQWGVKPDGVIFIRPLSAVGTGASQFTLNPTTTTEDDFIQVVRTGFESEEDFANIVVVTGQDERGFHDAAVAVNSDSIGTASAADFIGDDWWKSIHLDDAGDVKAHAETELNKAKQRRVVVEWSTRTKLELLPDDVVTVDVTNMGVATGTKFVIFEKMISWSVENTSVTYKGEVQV